MREKIRMVQCPREVLDIMATRPTYIDLRSQSHGPLGESASAPRPLPSPRLCLAGEIPPELSPLDAFAAQSRRLAKQLEKQSKGGRRISRLPPLILEQSFPQSRPGFFRSVSAENLLENAPEEVESPTRDRIEMRVQPDRPVSVHPRLSRISTESNRPSTAQHNGLENGQFRGRQPPGAVSGYNMRRNYSPKYLGPQEPVARSSITHMNRADRASMESIRNVPTPVPQAHNSYTGARSPRSEPLAPLRAPSGQGNTLVRSASPTTSQSGHDVFSGESTTEPGPNPLSGCGLHLAPVSPSSSSVARSPSVASNFSTGGSRLSRPAFNFSRPLSRASGLSPEIPSRQLSTESQSDSDLPFRNTSSDGQPSFSDETVHTPISMHSDGFPENGSISPGAPSYVYSVFSLPRGKMLKRGSRDLQENMTTAEFSWEQPLISHSNVQRVDLSRKPSGSSTPPPPPTSTIDQDASQSTHVRTTPQPYIGNSERAPALDAQPRATGDADTSSPTEVEQPRPSTGISATTASRGPPLPPASSTDYIAEDHVTRGIECHERGSLKESTYHLRIAARQNHPTGMLLYALACRHGWGMRPNPQEGVEWLRKAADFAFTEVTDDENSLKAGRSVDLLEQKTRKAQFALSIYELGVSHMNGWGIEQDKVLALRCFEIAGGSLFPLSHGLSLTTNTSSSVGRWRRSRRGRLLLRSGDRL